MAALDKMKPIDNLSLVDKAEMSILEYFKEFSLKSGDPIPKELEFSEALGVSRTVIREALLRLRTLGLIESKKHRGMILTQPDLVDNFQRMLDPTLLDSITLGNLFELRLIMEMGIADFIFEYKTQEDLDELDDIVAQEEKEGHSEFKFSLDREIAFHGKIYQISNNSTAQRFQSLLLPVFGHVYLENGEYQYSSGQFVTHRMLLDNLKVGTPESYRTAMRRHLEPHFERVFKKDTKTASGQDPNN